MRIMTVVRQVLDAEESISIQNASVALDGRKLVLDTMDEYGVEEALRLREGEVAGAEVIALAIGPARSEEALRSALAMGADRAILVETDTSLDVIAVSNVVAQVARSEQIDLIFCGGQQADWDSHALGAATAERLEWPQTTWTSALALKDGILTGKHDVDGGSESFALPLPAVVTTQQGLNEPRYPTLPNIMKAKRKELRRQPLDDYGISAKLRILGVEVQVTERRRNIIDGKDAAAAAARLVDLLRHDAGVIG
jgi:electron transfer flavoprotein beta subunit